MFQDSANYYDLLYSFKDYQAEADTLAGMLGDCSTLLDVACGSGEHYRFLSRRFEVDGLDLNPQFLELARLKNPRGRYFEGDMSAFDLGQKYDAVTCLFSSIGYLHERQQIVECLRCMARHARRLLLVEPWFEPQQWNNGRTQMLTHETEDLKICRVSRSSQEGELAVMECRFVVARPEGLDSFEEVHRLRLSTRAEMESAFAEAGLDCIYDDQGLDGRGLYRVKLG